MYFRLLGPIRVTVGDTSNPLRGSKQRTVLATMLLAKGRPVSDEQLADRLWGERPPTTASAQIYTYLSRLRKSFGSAVTIARLGTGYQMAIDDLDVDLIEFDALAAAGAATLAEGRFAEAATQLRRALALWEGEALAGATEHLVDAERPRLEELRLAALESRIAADLALGRHHQVTAELTGLVQAHPLREHLRAQLMTALVRGDRQADATNVFHEGRRLLRDEFGVEPGATLRDTYQDMLTGSLVSPHRALARGDGPPAMLPRTIPDFIGRRREVDGITAAIASDRDRPVFVAGPFGMGKTTLVIEAAHANADQFPDGQLYSETRTASGEVVPTTTIVGRFLVQLGIARTDVPSGLMARVALYRSTLASKRVLVVVDDVETSEQVECLQPRSRLSMAILVSPDHTLAPPDARVIAVDALDHGEAAALLTSIAEAAHLVPDPLVIRRILDCCTGVPLALRILGSKLAAGPDSSVAQSATEFAERLAYA